MVARGGCRVVTETSQVDATLESPPRCPDSAAAGGGRAASTRVRRGGAERRGRRRPQRDLGRAHRRATSAGSAIPAASSVEGRLTRMVGLTLEAIGCRAAIGGRCDVVNSRDERFEAEVVGFAGESLYLMPTARDPRPRAGCPRGADRACRRGRGRRRAAGARDRRGRAAARRQGPDRTARSAVRSAARASIR